MSRESPFAGEISSIEEFDTMLEQLLLETISNDVDPTGAWEYETDGNGIDWEVMVFKLESDDGPE